MGPRLWANWTRPYFNKKGQAILELAVFGSVLIMLLGVLVNYGLKYNFQQQTMQQAFRKALGVAAEPLSDGLPRGSATYILIKDRHIPNPSNPFGVGSVVAVSSSASVVRDYRMHQTADKADELSRMDIEIQGQTESFKGSFKTAAFRDEHSVPLPELGYKENEDGDLEKEDAYNYKDEQSKYEYIYGSKDMGWWVLGDGECACETESVTDPTTGEVTETCPCPSKNIRIIDNCAGEIMNYETVQLRCKKIRQAGIRLPWYCNETEALFAFSNSDKPGMGLQADYAQDTAIDNTLRKQESASDVYTTDTLDWQVDTQRTIVYNDAVDASGVSREITNVKPVDVTSTVSQEKTYEWETAF